MGKPGPPPSWLGEMWASRVLCGISKRAISTAELWVLGHFRKSAVLGQEAELHRRASKYTLLYFQVQRAKMILYAAKGKPNDEIANCLDTRREVVSLWRKRFFIDRLAGLEERDRSGLVSP